MLQSKPSMLSLTGFNVVFTMQDTVEEVVLCSSQDADGATIALEGERNRLLRNRVQGELRIVRRSNMGHTLLRESLSGVSSRLR